MAKRRKPNPETWAKQLNLGLADQLHDQLLNQAVRRGKQLAPTPEELARQLEEFYAVFPDLKPPIQYAV